MRITNITNCINFTAGKVQVYSDFDGTYCPAKHSSIRDNKRFNKVLEVEKGELDKGLKEVIKYHSETNEAFKSSMSDKFKKYILGSEKSNVKPILIASIIGILGALGIYLKTRNRKNNK